MNLLHSSINTRRYRQIPKILSFLDSLLDTDFVTHIDLKDLWTLPIQDYIVLENIVGAMSQKPNSVKRGSKQIWLRELNQDGPLISLIYVLSSPRALQVVDLRHNLELAKLLRHLHFPGQYSGFQVNPGLPSETAFSLSIRVPSLGHSRNSFYGYDRSLLSAQKEIQDNLDEFLRGSLGWVTVGRECYRKITVHGRQHFSV